MWLVVKLGGIERYPFLFVQYKTVCRRYYMLISKNKVVTKFGKMKIPLYLCPINHNKIF